MKLKQRPEDFAVEEITSVIAGSVGPFSLYRLEKRGWTTPDALAAVRERWKIDTHRVSFGGLKDRHAHTIQYLTIHNGPKRNFAHDALDVAYLGRVDEPFTSSDIRANRFRVTLRNLTALALKEAESALPEIADAGVANYFDDQRFGSLGDGQSFVGKEMVLSNFEQALRLALAAPYEHDRSEAKLEKVLLEEHWGDWATCKTKLPHGHTRQIVEHLHHNPADFRGACERLRPELQGLYLAAWQGHLWNRMLSRWLIERVPGEQLAPLRLKPGVVMMPRAIPANVRPKWDALVLPLPSARLKFDPAAPWANVVTAVMDEEGIPLDHMRIKDMRKPFFSKGERIGRIPVSDLSSNSGEDELNSGEFKLTLHFELPRGCYATMVVKRLTA